MSGERREEANMNHLDVVSQAEWLAARKELLAREKEFSHRRDELSAERRKLPMVKVEKEYTFEGPKGPTSLRDLFEGHPQLIIYHFMFDPDWAEGCKGCSFFADNFVGSLVHLPRNTVMMVFLGSGAKHLVCGHLPRAPVEDREVQETDGMEFPVAIVLRQ